MRRAAPTGGWRESLEFLRPGVFWRTVRSYLGLGDTYRETPVDDPDSLARFLDTRASFIAQTTLYGYLRTRAGMRYPELFEDDPFVEGINIAKWHLWLACLSDLAVYAGGRLAEQAPREVAQVGTLLARIVDQVLEAAGTPGDAGGEFAAHAARVRDRIARCDWLSVGDDEAAFTESPDALVRWAPIVDELKALDEDIVRNSVRYRWQDVRREFRRTLDAAGVLSRSAAA